MPEEAKPEAIKESSPLPVSKEAAEQALREIAQDPLKALKEERDILQNQNPVLSQALDTRYRTSPIEQLPYSQGALFTYRILRRQAELNGINLPRVSSDATIIYVEDRIKELKSGNIDQTKAGYNRKLVERVIAEEPELGNAIKEMTKYNPTKEIFYNGAADVYFLIKRTLEAKELGKRFGI
ncbi:hypothetical protein HYU45_00685 [Candidatus Daviesbacteria bacterium]|nr:hypothetical protein [Candidatus Daviesbacteria bacterium]